MRRDVQYGVMVDRRSAGLGILFAHQAPTREQAERYAAELFADDWPVIIKARLISFGDWIDLDEIDTPSPERPEVEPKDGAA